MMNQVSLVGRLTKDPDLRYTPTGVAVAHVTLACKRTFKNSNGEFESDFIRVVIWRNQAENTSNYMKTGDILGVTGRIQTGSYEGQDGKRVYTTDVVADDVRFIHSISRQGGNQGNQGGNQGGRNNQGNQGNYNNQGNQGNYNNQGNNNNNQGNNNNNQGNQGDYNNYTRVDEDPFAVGNQTGGRDPFASNGPQTVEISDDDLPF